MIWWLDSMVQIIKCFASLPDKTELHRSQHNKAPYPRWLEYKVPSSAVLQIFGHRDLQINYHVFVFAFSVDKKTKRPFQNPLCLCLRFLFWDSLYGTQHISENSFGGGGEKADSTQHGTAIYWQTHKIEQKEKHPHYSLS